MIVAWVAAAASAASAFSRIADYLLPLFTNLLVGNLREVIPDGLHKILLLVTLCKLQSLLDHKVAVVMAN